MTQEQLEYNALPSALKLVQRLWKLVLQNNEVPEEDKLALITEPVFNAAKFGNVGFLRIIARYYPDVIMLTYPDNKTIFHIAIEYRQEEVFRLILDLGALKETFTMYIDEQFNGMLHLAAKLPADRETLNLVPGPALQMQEEVRWFKAVKDIMKPQYSQYESVRHKFEEEHEDLRVKGEKWMKKAATSYALVATLVASVMFAASTTFPQNWKENVHCGERKVFAISDAVSLITSTSSILMFVSILTSRCKHDHFLRWLPFKLVGGIIFLILAFVAMMIAFVVTLRNNVRYHALWIASASIAGVLMVAASCCHDYTFTTVLHLVIRTKLHKRLSHPLL